MKTTLTNIALLLTLSAVTPVAMAETTAKKEKTVTTEETTTTTTKEVKSEPGKPAPGTIAAVLKDSVTFSVLYKAIQAAGLEESLTAKGPNTIFAPTDEAFGKLPAGTLDKLMLPENKEKLRTLLLFHVIPGEFLSSSFKDGEIKTSSGDKVEIDVDGSKIEVGKAKVANADVVATNGVIHVVDQVIVPKSLDGFAKLDD